MIFCLIFVGLILGLIVVIKENYSNDRGYYDYKYISRNRRKRIPQSYE